MSLPLAVSEYLSPKAGMERAECEDALAFNRTKRCFAIADGATEAFASRFWARLLVRGWMRADPPPMSRDTFLDLTMHLGVRAQKRWQNRSLSWYAEEKARVGSYAAFAGVGLADADDAVEWQGITVGDCCIVQVSGGVITTAVPYSDPGAFGYRPYLLPSLPEAQEATARNVLECGGYLSHGDVLYLLSDAAACWFLGLYGRSSSERIAFDDVAKIGDRRQLDVFFSQERAAGRLKNDDVAMIRIALG